VTWQQSSWSAHEVPSDRGPPPILMPADSTSPRLRITAATAHRYSLRWQFALAGDGGALVAFKSGSFKHMLGPITHVVGRSMGLAGGFSVGRHFLI